MKTVKQLALLPGVRDKTLKKQKTPREKVGQVLLLGAGVQSSALAEMMAEGDLPPAGLAIFADTGNEPEWVYNQVDYLRGRLESVGVALHIVSNGNIIEDITGYRHEWRRFASIPLYTLNANGSIGMLRRQCTSEYKIQPADDFVLSWMIDRGYAKVNSRGARRVSRNPLFIGGDWSAKPTEGNAPIMKLGGKSERTKELRSLTPPGFAKAFFLANP